MKRKAEEEERRKNIILESGARGDKVRVLQKKLFNIGYNISVDGSFGKNTSNILKEFQSTHSLEVNGYYDKKTKEVLDSIADTRDYDTIKAERERKEREEAESIPLEDRIISYLGSHVNKVGFIYYDLTTGEKISINPNKVCVAASTYKLGLAMVAYDRVREGSLSLSDTVMYESSMYERGTGILQNQISTTLKNPLPINKLIDLSITHSDNIATNMLASKLGGHSAVRREVAKMTEVSIDTSKNRITPELAYRKLKILYENRSDEHNAHLISKMKNTIFHDRIAKYLPRNKTAHKIGNYGSYVNDIGIVYTDKPYIIVIYMDGVPNSYERIAVLSKMVYDAQLKK